MKYKLLIFVSLFCIFSRSALTMFGRSLSAKKPTIKSDRKDSRQSLSSEYLKPQLAPSIVTAAQQGRYSSVVAESLSKPVESSKSVKSIPNHSLPNSQGSLFSRLSWGDAKFKSSSPVGVEAKSHTGFPSFDLKQVSTMKPSSQKSPLRRRALEDLTLHGSKSKNASSSTNPFSRLNEVDRVNLAKMKKLMNALRIDSAANPQYRAKLQEWFNGKLPENITFQSLKQANVSSIQPQSQVVGGFQGRAASRRSLDELLSKNVSINNSSVSPVQKVGQKQVNKPLTQEQVENKIADKSASQAVLGKKPNDFLVSLTVPNKAKDLAQQAMTKHYENIAEAQFLTQKSSLVSSYKNENAIALAKIQKSKGQPSVDARINRVMYERLIADKNIAVKQNQKSIDRAGLEAKSKAKQELEVSQGNTVSRVLESGDMNSKGKISQVKNEAQVKKTRELKEKALQEFKKDEALLNEIKADYKDQYFKDNRKLAEVKDVQAAVDNYFNLTVMSQVKKANKAAIDKAGQDAVNAFHVQQNSQAQSSQVRFKRRGLSPVAINDGPAIAVNA